MHRRFEVDNVKCGGCARTIEQELGRIDGVSKVRVDIRAGAVDVHGEAESVQRARRRLNELGYPESGSLQGNDAAAAWARSYASCAVGRLGGH